MGMQIKETIMADRRSQSDESLIVEYFTVQPLAACDALLNQIADILRKRRPRKTETGNNAKPAIEPERKPSQRRKAGKEAQPDEVRSELDQPCVNCTYDFDDNVHHKRTDPGYHEFQPDGYRRTCSTSHAFVSDVRSVVRRYSNSADSPL